MSNYDTITNMSKEDLSIYLASITQKTYEKLGYEVTENATRKVVNRYLEYLYKDEL